MQVPKFWGRIQVCVYDNAQDAVALKEAIIRNMAAFAEVVDMDGQYVVQTYSDYPSQMLSDMANFMRGFNACLKMI